MTSAADAQRILVIRLGALGDITLCAPAFQAIRAAHPRADIALLTQPAWLDFTSAMPWFDRVLTDSRPRPMNMASWIELLRCVRRFEPDMVYDLQGKARQSVLFWLLGGPLRGPAWSGAARLCRYPRVWPPQTGWHFADFLAAQLHGTGITVPEQADWSWFDAPVDGLRLPEKFILLIPGCAPTRPEKRWPAAAYAAVARHYQAQGLGVVMIGTRADGDALEGVKRLAPGVLDLGGRTSLPQIGAIARRAAAVLANDTGPAHLAAVVGAPVLTLFPASVNPVWSQPRGPRTAVMQGRPLADMEPARVIEALRHWTG